MKGRMLIIVITSIYLSVVTQRCLDDNPDITWKRIMMSLLDAKECILTNQILTDIECSCIGKKGQINLLWTNIIITFEQVQE